MLFAIIIHDGRWIRKVSDARKRCRSDQNFAGECDVSKPGMAYNLVIYMYIRSKTLDLAICAVQCYFIGSIIGD